MQDIQPELIEKFQILLQNDPKSQVFAPLSEAYRKMGLVEEAFRIATRGVQFNPQFGGGRIALAKIFLERDNVPGAIDELVKAADLSPDNILAHSLLGQAYLKSQRPKDALRSFKMVLFLAPQNEKALKAVSKLEALTADEYDDDLFEMKQLPQVGTLGVEKGTPIKPLATDEKLSSELDRFISLSDAYIVRNDMERALGVLKEGETAFGGHPEIVKRMKLINQRNLDKDVAEEVTAPPPNRALSAMERKIAMLQILLKQVREYSQFTDGHSSTIPK